MEHLKQNYSVDEGLLKHIISLGWEHINLLGEYNFDVRNIPESDELRPLNGLEWVKIQPFTYFLS